MTRQDYISQWNTLFTNYVNTTLGIIAGRMSQPGIEVEWNEKLGALKFVLEGKDICGVNAVLAQGKVTDDTLDKTAKIYAEIDIFLVYISVKGDAENEFLKKLVPAKWASYWYMIEAVMEM